MLKQAVLAINSPKHRHHSGTPKGLGHAFCEYVTRYPIDRLPQAGGVDATIVVTMTLENLLGDSQTPALLDTGDPITADQARKLACEAGIIPIVLGGKSKILDLGRSKRLYDRYQRIAIRHRDQHCTSQGCDWPAAMCHVHHNIPWSRGGKTDLADGRLLCPRHHSYAHTPEVPDEDHPQRTRRLQPHIGRVQPGKDHDAAHSRPVPFWNHVPMAEPEKVVARNRKARHDYHIEDTFEAGIVLVGTEVKSLRAGRASLVDGFAEVDGDEVWLHGVHIPEYTQATWTNHAARRKRKLLLHRAEIDKIERRVNERGLTIVPLSLYFKDGRAKVEIALARGKKTYDKRHALAERQATREAEQAVGRRLKGMRD